MKVEEMKVGDILSLPEFTEQMRQIVENEKASYQRAAEAAVQQKMRLKRCVLSWLLDRDVMDAARMVELFAAILNKSLIGFSSEERSYIYELGLQAGRITIKKLQEKEKEQG